MAEDPAKAEPAGAETESETKSETKTEPAETEAEPEPAEVEVEARVELEDFFLRSASLSPFLYVSGRRWLVLHSNADLEWTTGATFEPPGSAAFRVAKRVDPRRLPPELWAQRKRRFDLYGSEGKLCTTAVGELWVIALHSGPDGDDLIDGPDFVEDEPGEAPPVEVVRAKVWETEEHWLVAELLGDCGKFEVLWARDAALPPPLVLTASSKQNPVADECIRGFRRSKELAQMRAAFQEHYDGLDAKDRDEVDDWPTVIADFPPEVRSWLDPKGQPRFVELTFGRQPGCGDLDYDTHMSSFERLGEHGLERLEHPVGASAIFDADLDGEFEIFYGSWDDLRIESKTLDVDSRITVDGDLICGC